MDQISGALINAAMRATAITRRIADIGVTHRTRSCDEIRAEYAAMRRDLWDAVQEGRFAIPIDKVFPLDRATEALADMTANLHFGKIALTI